MADLSKDQFHAFSQMEAMDHEYPTPAYQQHKDKPLYHGTTAAIKDGMVRPANAVDKHVSEYSMGDPGDMSEGDHAFATHDEQYAWHASLNFHPSKRRSRVYEAEAAPDMTPGPWNKDHPDFLHHHELADEEYPPHPDDVKEAESKSQPEYGSPTGFPVRKRIDIMPGRQGTFPNIAWGRFSKSPHNQATNHPRDDQVRYGLQGQEGTLRAAHRENEAYDEARQPKRTGSRLKAFMMGQPDPGPLADHPKLF